MSKVIGIYIKFTKPPTKCDVTLASNSEKFYFSPNSVLNFWKSYQIWGKLTQEQLSYKQKTNWGLKTPPPPPVLIELIPELERKDRKEDIWYYYSLS